MVPFSRWAISNRSGIYWPQRLLEETNVLRRCAVAGEPTCMESRRTTRRFLTRRLGFFFDDANCAACVVLHARGSTARRRSLRPGRITAENNRRPPSTNLRLRSAPPSAIGLKDAYCVAEPTHEQQEGGPHTSRSGLELSRRGTKQTNTKDTNQWSPDDLFVRRFATHRHDCDSMQPQTLLTIERLLSDISWTRRSIAKTSIGMLNTSVVWQEWGQTHVMPGRLPVTVFVM